MSNCATTGVFLESSLVRDEVFERVKVVLELIWFRFLRDLELEFAGTVDVLQLIGYVVDDPVLVWGCTLSPRQTSRRDKHRGGGG